LTLNKYMAMGPSGARCQVWACRLIAGSKLLLLLLSLSLSLILRWTVSRQVCLGIKHSSRAYDQIFITVWQLRVCCCGAFSLTRGRVCRLQLLLVLASAVIIRSESLGTRDHILLSQNRDLPFRRLLRLAGLRLRYSTPPSTRDFCFCFFTRQYKRLKLGGGQAYDRSSD
jgi:hypothetical protein